MNFKLKILWYLIVIRLTKWLYRKKLSDIQKRRFRSLLRSLKKSPYYGSVINPDPGLTDFPLMDKMTFMQHFDTINTCGLTLDECMQVAQEAEQSRDFSPMINGISVGLSTGTSGNRGVFLVSEKERAVWVAMVLDRVIGFSLRKRKVAFFLRANNNLYQSTQSGLLEFCFFDIFKKMDENMAPLHAFQPAILVAQPSVLCMIAEEQIKGKLSISPQKIISVAEVLSVEDKNFLEEVFQQTIHQVYQCTEGFLASSCKYGTMHFNEDFLIIEKKYIDSEKTRFHPVITDLLRRSQPIVRYELNDIITEKQNCACGSSMLAIESIDGRSDDILVFKSRQKNEVRLFPDILRNTIVLSDENISDYCLIQSAPDQLKLYIKSTDKTSYNKALHALEALLAGYDIYNVAVQKLEQDPLITGSKKRRIKNER